MPQISLDELEDGLKAISIYRPWTWAIYSNGNSKRHENRSWKCPLRPGDPIAIHAGKKWDKSGVRMCNRILWCSPIDAKCPTGIVAIARFIRNVTESDSPWFVGPIGWELADVVVLERPVDIGGAQRLWSVPSWALKQIKAQLKRQRVPNTRLPKWREMPSTINSCSIRDIPGLGNSYSAARRDWVPSSELFGQDPVEVAEEPFKIFTFGYGNRRDYTELQDHLAENCITRLIDVRLKPRGWSPRWSAAQLQKFCSGIGVGYTWMTAFGNVSGTSEWIPPNYAALDEAYKKAEFYFGEGREGNVMLMCAELDHKKCHRTAVAEEFSQRFGGEIVHLR